MARHLYLTAFHENRDVSLIIAGYWIGLIVGWILAVIAVMYGFRPTIKMLVVGPLGVIIVAFIRSLTAGTAEIENEL